MKQLVADALLVGFVLGAVAFLLDLIERITL